MLNLRRVNRMQPLPGAIAALVAAIAGYTVRYQLVEPERLGAACERSGPWWCVSRTAFIMFTEWNGFGWLSVGLCALAAVLFFSGRRPTGLAMAAMSAGGAGLILYNASFSVVAVVAAAVLLAKMAEKPA